VLARLQLDLAALLLHRVKAAVVDDDLAVDQRREPSSDSVKNVYLPSRGILIRPDQRT
jgi:hypothetical protein